MSGIFSSPSPRAPTPPPPPPERSDAEIQAEAFEKRRLLTNTQGRASTILTKAEDADSLSTPATKKLLGA